MLKRIAASLLALMLFIAPAHAGLKAVAAGVTSGNAGTSNMSPRVATEIVAAFDSQAKLGADFIANTTGAEVTIAAAENAMPNQQVTGGYVSPSYLYHTGKIILRSGTYNTAATISWDCDLCTLEGESFPMWGGYNAPWSSTSSPNGAIGIGETKLQASATGYPVITLENNNIPSGNGTNANDQNRHRGIALRNLYIVGNAYNADCIASSYGASPLAGGDDFSIIEDNQLQRCANGINIGQDSWIIQHNSIQDVAGPYGIEIQGTNGTITDNLIYDSGVTYGIYALSGNCIISGNRVGNMLGSSGGGIYAGGGCSVIANQVTNTNESGITTNSNAVSITGNTVFTNSPNGGAPINLNGGTNNTVTGNTVAPFSGNSSAAAIYLGSGSQNLASGNNISGTFSAGYILASSAAVLASDYVWHNDPAITLIGTTAGTVVSSITLNGNSKIFTAVFNAYENNTATNQTITYSIPFVNKPACTVNTLTNSLTVTATSNTVFTINSLDSTATSSGVVICQGQ